MHAGVCVRTRYSDDTRSASDAIVTTRLPPLVCSPPPLQQQQPATAVTIVPHSSTTKRSTTTQSQSLDPLEQLSLRTKPKKTNSDRGKEFRAKRKEYEATLAASVDALRREVDDLCFLRSVRVEKSLRSRNSRDGPLARVAQEYFAFFQHGMPDAIVSGSKRAVGSRDGTDTFATRQLAFLKSAMDPDLRYGECYGIAPLVEQWKRYTSFHAALRVDVVSIDVTGPPESPIVTVTSVLHTRFSRNTIANIFPHVLHDAALVARLVGKHVAYRGVNKFQFSDSGQIVTYDSDVGFVGALLDAGVSPSDIATLMNHAMVTTDARLGEDDVSCSSSVEPALNRVVEILSDDDDDDDAASIEQQQMAPAMRSPDDSEHDTDSEQALSPGRDADERDTRSRCNGRDRDCETRDAASEKATLLPLLSPPVSPTPTQQQQQQPSSRHDVRFLLS